MYTITLIPGDGIGPAVSSSKLSTKLTIIQDPCFLSNLQLLVYHRLIHTEYFILPSILCQVYF